MIIIKSPLNEIIWVPQIEQQYSIFASPFLVPLPCLQQPLSKAIILNSPSLLYTISQISPDTAGFRLLAQVCSQLPTHSFPLLSPSCQQRRYHRYSLSIFLFPQLLEGVKNLISNSLPGVGMSLVYWGYF